MLKLNGSTLYSMWDLRQEARAAARSDMARRGREHKQHGLDTYEIKIAQNGLTVLIVSYHDATCIYHTSVVL